MQAWSRVERGQKIMASHCFVPTPRQVLNGFVVTAYARVNPVKPSSSTTSPARRYCNTSSRTAGKQ